MPAPADRYRDVAEAAWAWVLAQVRWDDGPWIPASVPAADDEPPWDRDGTHSGIGGLAFALAEIRLARDWNQAETQLADEIVQRLGRQIPTMTDVTYFDGLVSGIGVLTALDAPGVDVAVARLAELATPDGWAQSTIVGPRYVEGARVNDLTLGTAGVLLGAVWAHRNHIAGATALADHAAAVLLAEAQERDDQLDWPFVPHRFLAEGAEAVQMPNLSHGVAGIATALALAGAEFDRPDLIEAAHRGAQHVISLGDSSGGGFTLPIQLPPKAGQDAVTFSWCHGPTGTSLLFPALELAGVTELAGHPTPDWRDRALTSVRTSGLPERLRPGFWDNDGRCCGTAGVADVLLDAGDPGFALRLADVLVEREISDQTGTYWRFIEHRNAEPLLPPGVGWMQGAAGIAAYLFRASRVAEQGAAAVALARIDNWWAVAEETIDAGHNRSGDPAL
jgi:hypothetical protein